MDQNPQNTVFSTRRLIGRHYDDEDVQRYLTKWSFNVVKYYETVKIQVKYEGKERKFFPEEISTILLKKAGKMAKMYLNEEVTQAVITVPAYFNDSQRKIIRTAGTNAELHVLDIISEPIAAALAYGLDKNVRGRKNVLVFDLGGSTLDVSILSIAEGSEFQVKSMVDDIHLGGDDFDNRLINHFLGVFKQQFNKDMSFNTRAIKRLRTACERAKKGLSSRTEVNLQINALHEGYNFSTTITRARFEHLCMDLFRLTLLAVEKALTDANLDKSQVDEVILAGGSTYIPKIQEMLQDFFCGKSLNLSINPDEVVAYGAAIHAGKLSDSGSANAYDFIKLFVCFLILFFVIVFIIRNIH